MSARDGEKRRGTVAVNLVERTTWFYESLQTFFTFNEEKIAILLHTKETGRVECERKKINVVKSRSRIRRVEKRGKKMG